MRLPDTGPGAGPSSAAAAAAGPAVLKGHRLPATALALSSDDRTAFSVSKDGSILKFDVETGRRLQQLYRCVKEGKQERKKEGKKGRANYARYHACVKGAAAAAIVPVRALVASWAAVAGSFCPPPTHARCQLTL